MVSEAGDAAARSPVLTHLSQVGIWATLSPRIGQSQRAQRSHSSPLKGGLGLPSPAPLLPSSGYMTCHLLLLICLSLSLSPLPSQKSDSISQLIFSSPLLHSSLFYFLSHSDPNRRMAKSSVSTPSFCRWKPESQSGE